MKRLLAGVLLWPVLACTFSAEAAQEKPAPLQEYAVPSGSHPHDVAPASDGGVWYTAQALGELGRLDPLTGEVRRIKLGEKSRPHGVIVGPDGAPWLTDGGLNAIVRVDPTTAKLDVFPLPANRANANLNTAAFGKNGVLWFTGQSGVYGRLDPQVGKVEVFDAPKGAGPYGIATAPDGTVYYASLAGNHIARLDPDTHAATMIEPPTPRQGARRVWPDSKGNIWVSEWNVGQVGRYDPVAGTWKEWRLPGKNPGAYAVYVDDLDKVWLSDFGGNTLVRFDPTTEQFESFSLPSTLAKVRQLLGRHGEVWGAESGVDKLVVVRTLPSSTSASPVAHASMSDTPEMVLRMLIRANAEKDLPTLEKHLAKDPDMIGYTIGGRKYVGAEEVLKALQKEFDAVTRLEITITDLHVWTQGEVAWFSMELNYVRHIGTDGRQKTMALPLRDTGVLQRRNGRWMMVSWHESFRLPGFDSRE
jgi:virginiamycin B lyase